MPGRAASITVKVKASPFTWVCNQCSHTRYITFTGDIAAPRKESYHTTHGLQQIFCPIDPSGIFLLSPPPQPFSRTIDTSLLLSSTSQLYSFQGTMRCHWLFASFAGAFFQTQKQVSSKGNSGAKYLSDNIGCFISIITAIPERTFVSTMLKKELRRQRGEREFNSLSAISQIFLRSYVFSF